MEGEKIIHINNSDQEYNDPALTIIGQYNIIRGVVGKVIGSTNHIIGKVHTIENGHNCTVDGEVNYMINCNRCLLNIKKPIIRLQGDHNRIDGKYIDVSGIGNKVAVRDRFGNIEWKHFIIYP
jgi:hypothetical protein